MVTAAPIASAATTAPKTLKFICHLRLWIERGHRYSNFHTKDLISINNDRRITRLFNLHRATNDDNVGKIAILRMAGR